MKNYKDQYADYKQKYLNLKGGAAATDANTKLNAEIKKVWTDNFIIIKNAINDKNNINTNLKKSVDLCKQIVLLIDSYNEIINKLNNKTFTEQKISINYVFNNDPNQKEINNLATLIISNLNDYFNQLNQFNQPNQPIGQQNLLTQIITTDIDGYKYIKESFQLKI